MKGRGRANVPLYPLLHRPWFGNLPPATVAHQGSIYRNKWVWAGYTNAHITAQGQGRRKHSQFGWACKKPSKSMIHKEASKSLGSLPRDHTCADLGLLFTPITWWGKNESYAPCIIISIGTLWELLQIFSSSMKLRSDCVCEIIFYPQVEADLFSFHHEVFCSPCPPSSSGPVVLLYIQVSLVWWLWWCKPRTLSERSPLKSYNHYGV